MNTVTAAEFQRKPGLYQDKALSEPVTITRNGRERLVLLSVEEYQRLKRRDRRAFAADELSAEQLAVIDAARVAARHDPLDDELRDWKP